MLKFSIRDLFWLSTVMAVLSFAAWQHLEHKRKEQQLNDELYNIRVKEMQVRADNVQLENKLEFFSELFPKPTRK